MAKQIKGMLERISTCAKAENIMEKQSPVQRIWELGKPEHGRLITPPYVYTDFVGHKKKLPTGSCKSQSHRITPPAMGLMAGGCDS